MNLRKLAVAACCLIVALGIVCAAQETTIKKVPMQCTKNVSGEKMYSSYCAACHGRTGRGNGPAAKALTTTPTDLSVLALQNHGKFPDSHVYTVIRGDANMPEAHGAKDMPLWEGLFRDSCKTFSESEIHQRIHNLTKYIETLQKG